MSGSGDGSVTFWIGHLKQGDHGAAHHLWGVYYDRMVRLARKKLRSLAATGAVEDEEDAAASAFDSICKAAARGGFERLNDREDLWQILTLITARKVVDQVRRESRQRRGGGRVLGESALESGGECDGPGLDRIAGTADDPGLAAMAAEQCQRFLDGLGDEPLRRVALLRMDGHSAEEIAEQLECSVRTVFNRLRLIRMTWEAVAQEPDALGHVG